MAGELTKVTDTLGNEIEYRYDPCGRLAEIRQYVTTLRNTQKDVTHIWYEDGKEVSFT